VPQGAMNALNPVMRVRDQIGDAIECLVVDEQRPEERLLRLYRVRRYTKRDELRISRRLARDLLGCCHFF